MPEKYEDSNENLKKLKQEKQLRNEIKLGGIIKKWIIDGTYILQIFKIFVGM